MRRLCCFATPKQRWTSRAPRLTAGDEAAAVDMQVDERPVHEPRIRKRQVDHAREPNAGLRSELALDSDVGLHRRLPAGAQGGEELLADAEALVVAGDDL